MKMKAITLWQPWAQLIVMGAKKIETRGWCTTYRGEIMIHAAKKPVLDCFKLMTEDAAMQMQIAMTERRMMRTDILGYYPTGVIVGKARLADCVKITEKYAIELEKCNPQEYAFGDFTPGRFAWVLEDVEQFQQPIPASGKQGLWNWEGDMKK